MDPTHAFTLEQEEERRLLDPNTIQNNHSQNLSREMLPPTYWAAGVIDATPHGVFAKMMNKPPVTTGNIANKSTLVLDHFNIPIGREAVDREMPRGTRIEPIIQK